MILKKTFTKRYKERWKSLPIKNFEPKNTMELRSHFVRHLVFVLCQRYINSGLSHSLELRPETNKRRVKQMQITSGVWPISAIDFVAAMPFKKFRPKFSVYQVCVTILEAKHLPQNANPLVVVKVGNRKRRTMIRERTDNPVYNEVKLFNLSKLRLGWLAIIMAKICKLFYSRDIIFYTEFLGIMTLYYKI